MRKLKVNRRRAHLHIMAPDQKVPTFTLQGLEIAGYRDEQLYDLPEVLTQRKRPVSTCNIFSDEKMEKWSYLKSIHMNQIQVD